MVIKLYHAKTKKRKILLNNKTTKQQNNKTTKPQNNKKCQNWVVIGLLIITYIHDIFKTIFINIICAFNFQFSLYLINLLFVYRYII
jgi:hypothetical protein